MINDVGVIIVTYNPKENFEIVVNKVLDETKNIIVVDNFSKNSEYIEKIVIKKKYS